MLNRRDFIKTGTALSGLIIMVRYAPSQVFAKETAGQFPNSAMPIKDYTWMSGPGAAKARYEGLAKVTGAKIYARDFRPRDIPHWPQKEYKVAILKATRVNQVISDFNFSSLSPEQRPFKVISGEDLENFSIHCPPFFNTKLLLKKGECATYFGQPIALLFFQPRAFQAANMLLQNPDALIQYGEKKPAPDFPPYLEKQFVKYKKDGEILFSARQNEGTLNLLELNNRHAKQQSEQIKKFSRLIEQDIEEKNWRVFSQTYKIQSIDPSFMEPECGLCWYDRKHHSLRFLSGSQSPYNDAEYAGFLFADKKCPIKLKNIEINACYPGGGFGGKDHSSFTLYLALAAVFADGVPINITNSRFDQFQFGLKRHAAEMQESIAVDDNNYFQVLKGSFIFDGGGYNNFSWAVPVVGADNANSASYFPNVDIHFRANVSTAVPAGSVRGFGAFQTQFALECLIDEAAQALKIDAIDLRLKNAWRLEQENGLGRVAHNRFQVHKVLEKAKEHPLWINRDSIKKQADANHHIGIGFAMSMKSYGTTRDAALAEIKLTKEGLICLTTNYLDMGNGVATTLALACAKHLGNNASQVKLGAVDEFKVLDLFSEFCTAQERLDQLSQNPRFTPEIMMSTAASAGAYQHRHVVLQASEILFQQGVWPAAIQIWSQDNPKQTFEIEKARWRDSLLTYPGFKDLSLAIIAQHMHKKGFIAAVMTHAYYQAGWAKAVFQIGSNKEQRPIDALAWRRGDKKYELQTRLSASFPSVDDSWAGEDVFTPCGALCKVIIEKSTGKVQVEEMHVFLDCGPVIQQKIVEGQVEGAVAMGIGQVLYEDFPPYEGGPGAGLWNFHRYHLPLAREVPVYKQSLHLIPPLSANDNPKGMAEAVLCPIPPALVNAIAHATSKRFRELPILADKVKEA